MLLMGDTNQNLYFLDEQEFKQARKERQNNAVSANGVGNQRQLEARQQPGQITRTPKQVYAYSRELSNTGTSDPREQSNFNVLTDSLSLPLPVARTSFCFRFEKRTL